jgi:putative oxidoreductase
MGLFFKARGNISIGLFLIRLTLGSVFLFAGAQKLLNIQNFITEVQALGMFDENFSFIIGFILPFVEIFFGALYIIGLFTPITSIVLSLMCVSFLIALGVGPVEYDLPFNYDWVFLACTLTTLFAGAGTLSFDALLDRKKKRVIIEDKKTTYTATASSNQPKVEYTVVEEVKEEKKDIDEFK